jgi:hypothetical protein
MQRMTVGRLGLSKSGSSELVIIRESAASLEKLRQRIYDLFRKWNVRDSGSLGAPFAAKCFSRRRRNALLRSRLVHLKEKREAAKSFIL